MTWRVFVCLGLVVAGCQFPQPPDQQPVDARVDAPPIDAAPTPARLTAPQDAHDFGGLVIGGTSSVFQVTVQNTGTEPSGAVALSLTGATPDDFAIVPTGDSSDCAGQVLQGGGTCKAQVRYQPGVDRAASASLVIAADPGGSVAVPVQGDALTPAALTSLTSTDSFGGVVAGGSSTAHRYVIRNDGEQGTGLLAVVKSGTDATDFVVVNSGATDCQGATLGQQGTCTVDVRFAPALAGSGKSATVAVQGTPGGAHMITVRGDGLNPGDLVVELPATGALDFGTRDVGSGATSPTQTIRVRNSGGLATGTLAVTVAGGGAASYALPLDGCNGNPLGAGVACDITVRFNPTAVGGQPATVTVRDTVSGAAQAVNLSGVGSGAVTVGRTGSGTVTSSPPGINCGATCTGSFTTTPVTLTAAADPSWQFDGWGGACAGAGTAAVCSLPLGTAMTSVSAAFRQLFTLTVSTTGAGLVTSSPAGITCGNGSTACAQPFTAGTAVTLTAEPDPGYEVFAWTGTGVSCPAAQRTCAVTMSAARTVAVEFRRQYTLAVTVTGSGTGTVSGSGGISCGTGGTGTCGATYFDGASVTLAQVTGAVGAGSQIVFGGWAGACTGTGACAITMTADRAVTATFTLQHRLTLTVSSVSGGMGSITANPGAFACATGTCNRFFDAGTTLTITVSGATSLDGAQSISGDCSSSPCTLPTLSGPRAVSAVFTHYACVPSTATCTAGAFTQCDATGNFVSYIVPNGAADGTSTTLTMNSYACPLGCHASGTRCKDVDASNGLNAAMDTAQVSPAGIDLVLPRNASVPAGILRLDTSTFDSATGEATIRDADNFAIQVPAMVLTQTGGPEILVLKVRTFTLRSGRTLLVQGSRALAIASHFDIFVGGSVDLSSRIVGVDGQSTYGAGQMTLFGDCSGVMGPKGAGGGGGAANGGNGAASTSTGGFGRSLDVPLRGGCDGYASGFGGGAAQLVSRTRVALGASAMVDVSGAGGACWGFGGPPFAASGGGGGGTLLFESPLVALGTGASIVGRGGSGAACNGSVVAFGNDGPTGAGVRATAVTCSGCGTSGAGGYESAPTGGDATAPGTSTAVAGGGGGVGQCVTHAVSTTAPPGAMRLRYQGNTTLPTR